MISLRSGLCILASTGVSLQKVVPLGIHTNVNTYAAVSYWSFFLEKVILYGEVAIKSRYLEAKPLKFSPPKSLCGTVGSPWVSLATLFGFWETLIKFSESMILYGKKSFFHFFFFLAR